MVAVETLIGAELSAAIAAFPLTELRSVLAAMIAPVCDVPGVKPGQDALVPLTLSGGGEPIAALSVIRSVCSCEFDTASAVPFAPLLASETWRGFDAIPSWFDDESRRLVNRARYCVSWARPCLPPVRGLLVAVD